MLCGLLIGDHGGSNIHDQVAHIFIVIRSEDDDNAMFNPGDNIEVNASKFINELSPYSLINTTDLFTDEASEVISKKYNIFGIDN